MSHKKPAKAAANPGWFAKGKSGNPNGRPALKRAVPPNAAALDIMMSKTLTIMRNVSVSR